MAVDIPKQCPQDQWVLAGMAPLLGLVASKAASEDQGEASEVDLEEAIGPLAAVEELASRAVVADLEVRPTVHRARLLPTLPWALVEAGVVVGIVSKMVMATETDALTIEAEVAPGTTDRVIVV